MVYPDACPSSSRSPASFPASSSGDQPQQQPPPSSSAQAPDTTFPFAAQRFQQQQLYEQQHQRVFYPPNQQASQVAPPSQSSAERELPHIPRVLRAVGGVGISILFMILTARVSHLYDLVDQMTNPVGRYILIVPIVFLLISDALGIVISLMGNLNQGRSRMKVRLKTIIGFNAVLEVLNLLANITKLVLGKGKWPPREVYLGRVFTSIWMLSIIYTFSSSRWDSDDSYRPT